MIKALALLLAMAMLAGCGANAGNIESTVDSMPSVTEQEQVPESEFTDEELFLQRAYWYLQSDEKDLFTWENGVLEPDYSIEESGEVICPEGLMDIQGRTLTRVKYVYTDLGNMQASVNLYFDGDAFVGTDYCNDSGERYYSYGKPYWAGEMYYCLFLDRQELSIGETLTLTCVLRNCGDKTRTFCAYAPLVMYAEYFQNGMVKTGGQDAAGQKISLEPGEVFTETHTLILENQGDLLHWEPGACKVLTTVELREGNFQEVTRNVGFSMFHAAEFTITEPEGLE